jgi:NAD-dependent SIR2 family protein deacetylase
MCYSDDQKVFECVECLDEFKKSDFDHIDDEFNEDNPTCPECQAANYLAGKDCEYCEQPAVVEYGGTPMCEECGQNYADGFNFD